MFLFARASIILLPGSIPPLLNRLKSVASWMVTKLFHQMARPQWVKCILNRLKSVASWMVTKLFHQMARPYTKDEFLEWVKCMNPCLRGCRSRFCLVIPASHEDLHKKKEKCLLVSQFGNYMFLINRSSVDWNTHCCAWSRLDCPRWSFCIYVTNPQKTQVSVWIKAF